MVVGRASRKNILLGSVYISTWEKQELVTLRNWEVLSKAGTIIIPAISPFL